MNHNFAKCSTVQNYGIPSRGSSSEPCSHLLHGQFHKITAKILNKSSINNESSASIFVTTCAKNVNAHRFVHFLVATLITRQWRDYGGKRWGGGTCPLTFSTFSVLLIKLIFLGLCSVSVFLACFS